jgi:hypothetical protein
VADRLESSLPGQRGTGTCGGGVDESSGGLAGDQPAVGVSATLRFFEVRPVVAVVVTVGEGSFSLRVWIVGGE